MGSVYVHRLNWKCNNTAPNIQSRIGGGRAQITLGGNRAETEMLDEASDLVVVLRAGALPAPIRPANEQLIGPSLGADAVSQGIFGAGMGVLFVVLFMFLCRCLFICNLPFLVGRGLT